MWAGVKAEQMAKWTVSQLGHSLDELWVWQQGFARVVLMVDKRAAKMAGNKVVVRD